MTDYREDKSKSGGPAIYVDRGKEAMVADREVEKGANKRPASNDGQSPIRQRTTPGMVDLETLRSLLADQSAMLLEQQRNNMADMMPSLREEMKGGRPRSWARSKHSKSS